MPISQADAETIRKLIRMMTDDARADIPRDDTVALAEHELSVQAADIGLRAVVNFFNHIGEIRLALAQIAHSQQTIAEQITTLAEHFAP